jgi:hypothetical protein
MRSRLQAGILLAALLVTAGCSGAFWTGTGAGAGGTAAAYELRSRQQMEKIKDDLDAGRIDQKEYDIRRDQIQKGSLAY